MKCLLLSNHLVSEIILTLLPVINAAQTALGSLEKLQIKQAQTILYKN